MLQPPADCADAFIRWLLCRLPCLCDVSAEQYPGRGKSIVQCWHQGRHVQHRVLLAQQDLLTQALSKVLLAAMGHSLRHNYILATVNVIITVATIRRAASTDT